MFWRRTNRVRVYRLTADLAIGPQPGKRDWGAIHGMGFRAVVDLREETDDIGELARSQDLNYLRAPIVEGEAPPMAQISELADWIATHVLERGPVFVHCRQGRGRSAMIALAALMKLGLGLSDANSLLMRARPCAVISTMQMRALEAYAHSLDATGER